MIKHKFHQNAKWTLELPVTDELTGNPRDMSAATVSAKASVEGVTSTLSTTASGTSIFVEFEPNVFPAGYGEVQVTAEEGPDIQVWEDALVMLEAI